MKLKHSTITASASYKNAQTRMQDSYQHIAQTILTAGVDCRIDPATNKPINSFASSSYDKPWWGTIFLPKVGYLQPKRTKSVQVEGEQDFELYLYHSHGASWNRWIYVATVTLDTTPNKPLQEPAELFSRIKVGKHTWVKVRHKGDGLHSPWVRYTNKGGIFNTNTADAGAGAYDNTRTWEELVNSGYSITILP